MKAKLFLSLASSLVLQTLVLHGQPVITRQPVDRPVSLGALLTKQVTASGTPPLSYQWHFNETSQNDLRAHFGLSDATNIDVLRIEWPSGIVQELRDVAAKQFLTVTEPARLQAPGARILRIRSWKGMAFDVQASTNLEQWSPLTTVTNLTGTLEFTDPGTTNHSRRFYRTLLR